MVYVVVCLFEIYFWVVSGDFHQFCVQIFPERIVYGFSAVFGWEDEMIVAQVYAMLCSSVFGLGAHPTSILQNRGQKIRELTASPPLRDGVFSCNKGESEGIISNDWGAHRESNPDCEFHKLEC